MLPSGAVGQIAVLAAVTARRIGEIGFIIGGVGDVLLLLGAARRDRARRTHANGQVSKQVNVTGRPVRPLGQFLETVSSDYQSPRLVTVGLDEPNGRPL